MEDESQEVDLNGYTPVTSHYGGKDYRMSARLSQIEGKTRTLNGEGMYYLSHFVLGGREEKERRTERGRRGRRRKKK